MADLTKTVEIIFGAVDRDTKATITNIGNSLDTFDKSIQGIADPLANFTENLLKAEAAVTALAAAYGGYAITKAIEFQSAQIDLNKVLSDADPAVGEFTKTVTDLSEQYGVSSAAILQGIANFKQAGFSAQEAANLQKDALDLMIAGDVGAAEASQILISAIKGFGGEAGDAARYIEALNNVSNNFATDVEQLATGMARVAPIAHTMGFSFEETTALLTPLIEIFGSGEQAAEALKTGLIKLVDDAKPVREALASIGVAQTDANGQLRSGKDIFYDVANAFTTMDDKQKLFLTSQLVGIDQAPRMVLAFDNIAKIQEITSVALEKTGSVTKEVELRLASAEIQINRFKVGFDNLARVIGAEILTNFAGIAGGATEIEIAFRKIVENGGLGPLLDALKPQLQGFEDALATIAKNLPDAFKNIDFSGLLDAFGGLADSFKDAFSRIFDGADLTTVDGLHKSIQSTVNIITSLINTTKGIVEQFDPIFSAIGKAGKEISATSGETSNAAGSLLGAVTIIGNLGTSLGLLVVLIKQSEADIGNVFNTLVGGARIFTNAFQAAFDATALAITSGIASWAENVAKFLDFIGADETAKKFYATADTFRLTANAAKENLLSNAKDMREGWDQMTNGLSSSSDSASGSIKKVGDAAEQPKDAFKSLGIDSKVLTDSFEQFGYTLDPVTGKLEKVGATSVRTAEEIDKILKSVYGATEANGSLAKSFSTLEEAEAFAANSMGKFSGISITLEDGLYKVQGQAIDTASAQKDLASATTEAAKSSAEGSQEWKRVQDVMLESQKIANEYQLALGELAGKRYEIDVKAAVDLRVAEIQADTQRIQSALDATAQTVDSLTAGVTDLWGAFSGETSRFDQSKIEDAANRMEARLDEELAIKRQMTDAIVDKMKAETVRLASGEPLISIDAGTLAPELELVFDKILKYTQIKATQEGMSLLVGLA